MRRPLAATNPSLTCCWRRASSELTTLNPHSTFLPNPLTSASSLLPPSADTVDTLGRTALHYACTSSNVGVCRSLCAKMDRQLIHRPDMNKRSALHLAASNDMLGETVQYLVQREGLPVTQGDARKVTPLHLACLSGLSVAVSAMLDALGNNSIITTAVNAADSYGGWGDRGERRGEGLETKTQAHLALGRTPVHYAAYAGDDQLLRNLLRLPDCNVNHADNDVRQVCLGRSLR